MSVPTKETKDPSIVSTLWAVGRWVVERELLMRLLSIAAILAIGGGTVVYGQGYLDGGVEKRVAPLEKRTTELEAEVAQVKKQVANVERLGLETNLNVRLMLEMRGIKPIDVVAKDGGQ